MSQKKIAASHFSADIQEFLLLLYQYKVKYVIVGGEAVIYYGHIRLTGDIDLFYERSEENVEKLYQALKKFWVGAIPNLGPKDELMKKNSIAQFGLPPNRIDLINEIESVNFSEAWDSKVTAQMRVSGRTLSIYYIGLELLIRNKEKIKRPRDVEDLKFLLAIKK
jgi:hypothetical protein